jgi:hypothetical protein
MCKDELKHFFCIMFVIFHDVNLYICKFMTCSMSYCLYDILLDPWNVCMYEYCRGDLICQRYDLKVVGLHAENFVCITIKDNQCVYFFLQEFIVSWMGPY